MCDRHAIYICHHHLSLFINASNFDALSRSDHWVQNHYHKAWDFEPRLIPDSGELFQRLSHIPYLAHTSVTDFYALMRYYNQHFPEQMSTPLEVSSKKTTTNSTFFKLQHFGYLSSVCIFKFVASIKKNRHIRFEQNLIKISAYINFFMVLHFQRTYRKHRKRSIKKLFLLALAFIAHVLKSDVSH